MNHNILKMSHQAKQDLKDFLQVALAILTFASIIFYGGQIVQTVRDHDRRISALEDFEHEMNSYKLQLNK